MKTKKMLAVLLCISICLCLIGCESKDIKDAKEYIDNIYEMTSENAAMEIEKERCTDLEREAELIRKIALNEKMVETNTNLLMWIYEDLSEKGKQEIRDYVSDAYYSNLINIWS